MSKCEFSIETRHGSLDVDGPDKDDEYEFEIIRNDGDEAHVWLSFKQLCNLKAFINLEVARRKREAYE